MSEPSGTIAPSTIIFDLGGVLIDWNPRYLYRKLISDPERLEAFLNDIVSPEWNSSMDAGRPFSEAVETLSRQHPEHKDLIKAYHQRWPEMLGGPIGGTVEILKELVQNKNSRIIGLSNWSAETFLHARARFDFLKLFETILVSGEEKLIKPDPKFYRLLDSRLNVDFSKAVFIDDVQRNIDAAQSLGLRSILFKSPEQLRADLKNLGVHS